MAAIPGSVRFTGFVAPTDSTDTYPVIDPIWGIDGWRSVANAAARNAITTPRRREGMLVFQQDTAVPWRLLASPWIGTDADWVIFSTAATPGGSTTQVQFNDAGSLAGDAGMTYDKTNNQIQLAPGTASLPGYSIIGDLNTGIYGIGADMLGVTTGGVLRLTVSTTAVMAELPFNAPDGTAGAPSFTISSDPNTGIYSVGADVLGVAAGGVLKLSVSTTAVTSVVPVVGPAATAGAPSFTFTGDTDTGIYDAATDTLGVATSGVLRLSISTSALTSTLIGVFPATTAGGASVRLPHGTAPGSPVNGDLWSTTAGFFGQVNGSTVGPFSTTTGTITGSGTAAQVTYWSSSSAIAGDAGMVYDDVNNQLALAADTAALPSYSFIGDLDTGMFRVGANNLGLSTNGVLRWDVSTTAVTSTLIGIFPAATTGGATIRVPHGIAPSAPVNGDIWSTTAGFFGQVNGSTVGPFSATTGTVTGTGTTGQVSYWSSSSAIAGDAGMVYDAVNDQLALSIGTAALPAYSFVGDLNTGVYGVAADTLGFATNGVLRLSVSTTTVTSTLIGIFPATTTGGASVRLPHGTAPTSPVNGDLWSTTAGFFGQVNGSTVGPFSSTTGTVTGTGTTNQVSYWTSSSAIAGDAGMVYDATNNQIALAIGTASLPAYSFIGDLDTGMYGVGANDIGFATNGVLRLDVSTTAVTSTLTYVAPSGAVGTPGYAFVGDLNTGFYSGGADQLSLVAGGTAALTVTSTGVTIPGTLAGFLADVVVDATTTITLSSAHQGRVLRTTSGSAVAITMPNSLSIGFSCTIAVDGAGTVTVAAGSGATLHNRSSQFSSAGQYAMMTLVVLANAGGSAAVATLAGDTA